MRRLLKSKRGEDMGYLAEGVVGLAETVHELDAEQDQADPYRLGVPARDVRLSGYVWVTCYLARLGTPCKLSERGHITVGRPFFSESD